MAEENENNQERDAENNENLKHEGEYSGEDKRFETPNEGGEDKTKSEETKDDSDVNKSEDDKKDADDFKVDPEEWERTRKALAKANKESQDRRHKLQEWDELGVDPETVKAWKEERRQEEIRKAEEEGRYQEIIEKNREETRAEIEKFKEQRDQMEKQLENYLIDKNLTEAIAAEEGVPKLLQGIARQYVKTVNDEGEYKTVVVDEDGMPRKNAEGENMSIRELVKTFKEDPDLSYAFKAPKVSGNGSDSQGSNTPPSKKTGPKPKRSQMSPKEQRDFVREHGYEEFKKLPK